jgi:hypothetical protein
VLGQAVGLVELAQPVLALGVAAQLPLPLSVPAGALILLQLLPWLFVLVRQLFLDSLRCLFVFH